MFEDAFADCFVAVEGGAKVVFVFEGLFGHVEALVPRGAVFVEAEALVQGGANEGEEFAIGFFAEEGKEVLDFVAALAEVVGLFGKGGLLEKADGSFADADIFEDGSEDGNVAAVVVYGEGVLPLVDDLQAVQAHDGGFVVGRWWGEVEGTVVDAFDFGVAQGGEEVGDLFDEHGEVAQAVGDVEDGAVSRGEVAEDLADGGGLFGFVASVGGDVARDGFAELVAGCFGEGDEVFSADGILALRFDEGKEGFFVAGEADLLEEVVPHAGASAKDDELIALDVAIKGEADVGGFDDGTAVRGEVVAGFAIVAILLGFAEEGDEFAGHGFSLGLDGLDVKAFKAGADAGHVFGAVFATALVGCLRDLQEVEGGSTGANGGSEVYGEGAEDGVTGLDGFGVEVGGVMVDVPFGLLFDPVDGARVAGDEPGFA